MAIEATAQLAQIDNKTVLGYELRDIKMAQGLLVPDDARGTEVELTLRPCSDKALYAHGWKDFTLCSVNAESEWLEHCKGRILVEYDAAGSDATSTSVEDPFMSLRRARFGSDENYWKQVNVQDFLRQC